MSRCCTADISSFNHFQLLHKSGIAASEVQPEDFINFAVFFSIV